jgi:hypothetical protein
VAARRRQQAGDRRHRRRARVGTTDAAGSVTVRPLVSVPGSYRIVASFGGDTTTVVVPAGPFVVAKAPTSVLHWA